MKDTNIHKYMQTNLKYKKKVIFMMDVFCGFDVLSLSPFPNNINLGGPLLPAAPKRRSREKK